MYHVHFGLEKRVFDDGIAQDAAVFLGARQQALIADCSVALASSDAIVVLTGRPGTGKTTLAGTALRTTSTRLALGALSGGAIGAADLLEWLLTEFGFGRERGTRAERLQTWRQFLSEACTTDSRVFVVVERADDFGVEGLRSLAALTAADLNGCPGANLVLLGEAALLDLLEARELESLRQRIRLRHTLEPLSKAEVALYVSHHVIAAGGEALELFPPETLEALHAYSDGIPRLVNNLAETAASVAAARRSAHVTPALVEEVARKFLGLASKQPSAPAAVDDAVPDADPAANGAHAATDEAAVDGEPARADEAVAGDDASTDEEALAVHEAAADDEAVAADAPMDDAKPPAAGDAPASSDASAESSPEVPVLTDAVEFPERAAAPGDAAEDGDPRGVANDGYDDVEALPDMGAAMAETLFGDSDLDLLGAALASGGWEELASPPASASRLDATRAPRDGDSADGEDAAPFGTTPRAAGIK